MRTHRPIPTHPTPRPASPNRPLRRAPFPPPPLPPPPHNPGPHHHRIRRHHAQQRHRRQHEPREHVQLTPQVPPQHDRQQDDDHVVRPPPPQRKPDADDRRAEHGPPEAPAERLQVEDPARCRIDLQPLEPLPPPRRQQHDIGAERGPVEDGERHGGQERGDECERGERDGRGDQAASETASVEAQPPGRRAIATLARHVDSAVHSAAPSAVPSAAHRAARVAVARRQPRDPERQRRHQRRVLRRRRQPDDRPAEDEVAGAVPVGRSGAKLQRDRDGQRRQQRCRDVVHGVVAVAGVHEGHGQERGGQQAGRPIAQPPADRGNDEARAGAENADETARDDVRGRRIGRDGGLPCGDVRPGACRTADGVPDGVDQRQGVLEQRRVVEAAGVEVAAQRRHGGVDVLMLVGVVRRRKAEAVAPPAQREGEDEDRAEEDGRPAVAPGRHIRHTAPVSSTSGGPADSTTASDAASDPASDPPSGPASDTTAATWSPRSR